jgi:hypothetical protein
MRASLGLLYNYLPVLRLHTLDDVNGTPACRAPW